MTEHVKGLIALEADYDSQIKTLQTQHDKEVTALELASESLLAENTDLKSQIEELSSEDSDYVSMIFWSSIVLGLGLVLMIIAIVTICKNRAAQGQQHKFDLKNFCNFRIICGRNRETSDHEAQYKVDKHNQTNTAEILSDDTKAKTGDGDLLTGRDAVDLE